MSNRASRYSEGQKRINTLRVTAGEIKAFKVRRKIFLTLLAAIVTLTGLLYMASALHRDMGRLSVGINKADMTRYGLTLSEFEDMRECTSRLNAEINERISALSASVSAKNTRNAAISTTHAIRIIRQALRVSSGFFMLLLRCLRLLHSRDARGICSDVFFNKDRAHAQRDQQKLSCVESDVIGQGFVQDGKIVAHEHECRQLKLINARKHQSLQRSKCRLPCK